MSEVARLFAPMLLWLALFSGLYGLHGLGCGLGWPAVPLWGLSLHRVALVAGYLGSLLLLAALLAALAGPWAAREGFVRHLSRGLAIVALIAGGWTLFPVMFASSCG